MDKAQCTVYLLAWKWMDKEIEKFSFEVSTARLFRNQSVIYGGINRGGRKVVAFCDFIHGDDYLTKAELQEVALCFIDGDFTTIVIDLT